MRSFTVATADGRLLTGLIASETASAVTLRRQEGKEDVVLRRDIEEMAASGQSLMPEGLEKDLTPRDLADLLAFLEGSRLAAQDVRGKPSPGGQAQPDGTIVLIAADAEIHGDRLVFEAEVRQPRLLDGRQRSRRLDVRGGIEPGQYAVWLDWACPNDAAGNGWRSTWAASRFTTRSAARAPGTITR